MNHVFTLLAWWPAPIIPQIFFFEGLSLTWSIRGGTSWTNMECICAYRDCLFDILVTLFTIVFVNLTLVSQKLDAQKFIYWMDLSFGMISDPKPWDWPCLSGFLRGEVACFNELQQYFVSISRPIVCVGTVQWSCLTGHWWSGLFVQIRCLLYWMRTNLPVLIGRVSYIRIYLCYFCFRWKTVSLVQASLQYLMHHVTVSLQQSKITLQNNCINNTSITQPTLSFYFWLKM